VIVGEEADGRVEIEPTPVTQADPNSVTDVTETVAVLEQVTCASLIFVRNILLMRGSEHFTS
jgi:hypothetical protein